MKPKQRAFKLLGRLTRDKRIYRDEYLKLAMICCLRYSDRPFQTFESIEKTAGFGRYSRRGWDIKRNEWFCENNYYFMNHSNVKSKQVIIQNE